MKIPAITGTIDRRILVNYRVDEEVLKQYLPPPFSPKTINGYGIAGICLIRLKQIRPKGLPEELGISSENGAHRIAVEWFDNDQLKEGVYIPRRDTSSRINALAGGRIFPGVHHLAKFEVEEGKNSFEVGFTSEDQTRLKIKADISDQFDNSSIFNSLSAASTFFEEGSIGYSPGTSKGTFDGIELATKNWKVFPLKVSRVQSSFFENTKVFPPGSVEFDNALLMQNIQHEWHSLSEIKTDS